MAVHLDGGSSNGAITAGDGERLRRCGCAWRRRRPGRRWWGSEAVDHGTVRGHWEVRGRCCCETDPTGEVGVFGCGTYVDIAETGRKLEILSFVNGKSGEEFRMTMDGLLSFVSVRCAGWQRRADVAQVEDTTPVFTLLVSFSFPQDFIDSGKRRKLGYLQGYVSGRARLTSELRAASRICDRFGG